MFERKPLYTSYFGNSSKLRKEGIAIVSIARFNPKYMTDLAGWCLSVAPRAEMLRMSEEKYEREFLKILNDVDPGEIYHKVMEKAEGFDGVALCCYEKDINDCHRKTVGEWLTANGYACEEFGKSKQLKLF